MYLTKLLSTIDIFVGPEGGTTRVALESAHLSFIYRSSFESIDLLPRRFFNMPGKSMPVNSSVIVRF